MVDLRECDNFPRGSRKWQICRGEANMPAAKLNRYREHWGMEAIFEEEGSQRFVDKPRVHIHGFSLDQNTKRHIYGPGTELVRILKALGAPDCNDCVKLAEQMNEWGCNACRKKVSLIVDDIMPRAITFALSQKKWLKWIPDFIKLPRIRSVVEGHVTEAIDAAERVMTGARQRPEIPSVFKSGSPRKRGCGCGRKSVKAKRALHVSNLILDTTWGQIDPIERFDPKVRHIPFNGDPTRNLLYHIYPVGNHWQWNLDQILQRIDLFNGRRIVAIAVDENSASADDVRKYLGDAVHEYLVYENNPNIGEMVSFIPQLAQLETTDPNQITFRAHAKGVVQKTKKAPHIMEWTEMLYAANLDDIALVDEQLSRVAMTGACRKWDQFRKSQRLPTYSGTFYWYRNCFVYSRDWRNVLMRRWGCEAWPGRLFDPHETEVTFWDNTGSMYDPNYWERDIKPAYEEWKLAHTHHADR